MLHFWMFIRNGVSIHVKSETKSSGAVVSPGLSHGRHRFVGRTEIPQRYV